MHFTTSILTQIKCSRTALFKRILLYSHKLYIRRFTVACLPFPPYTGSISNIPTLHILLHGLIKSLPNHAYSLRNYGTLWRMPTFRLMPLLLNTTQLLYLQKETSKEVKSCLWTTVESRIMNRHTQCPILRSSGREINSIVFMMFYCRFHYSSVSILYYALVSFPSIKTTVGQWSTRSSQNCFWL